MCCECGLDPCRFLSFFQIRRIYGSNRSLCGNANNSPSSAQTPYSTIASTATSLPSLPARLDLMGLSSDSPMLKKLEGMFSGFDSAVLGKWEDDDVKAMYGPLAHGLEFVVLTPDR